jgi:signal transduction histidine kinase
MAPTLHRHFRVQILVRLIILIATVLLLAYMVDRTDYYESWILVGLAIAVQGAGLVRYGEKSARDLARFLEAVQYEDFTVGFTGDERGAVFRRLNDAFRAVTEAFKRVRAEREVQYRYLDHVVRHVDVALVSYRDRGRVTFVNPAARRLLGIGPLEDVRSLAAEGTPLAGVLASPPDAPVLVPYERDGQVLQLAVRARTFRLDEVPYVLVSMQDIRRELEEKELEAWQQLTRVLNHEIMNSLAPITSLASTARGLLDEATPAHLTRAREAVGTIARRGDALLHFVDAYRSLTRIPSPTYRQVEVRDLLERILKLLRVEIERRGVACTITVEPPGLQLVADPDQMEQVLINLVLNAVQAVADAPDPRIVLRAGAGARGLPEIAVEDNGPGIHPDVQARIFIPFFSTRQGGSGIGLTLARQIMRLHGGTLTLRSEPGHGAVFTLAF